ncbi:MAG: hypothetical protein BWY83_02757 [bacterium ADurb.Bin478]|nr:MAG: hypothetical protein BWY83_02757 [bacterium ADurb.Bin478]
MAAHPFGPVIENAVHEPVADMGFDFGLFLFLQPPGGFIQIFGIRKNRGHEDKAFAVRRPDKVFHGDGQMRHLFGLTAGQREKKDLPCAAAVGEEGQAGAVRLPARRAVEFFEKSQLPQGVVVRGKQPEIGIAAVFFHIIAGHDQRHQPAVRRQSGIADAFHIPQVLNRHGALSGPGECEQRQGAENDFFHGLLSSRIV